jgi:hypothetical protein
MIFQYDRGKLPCGFGYSKWLILDQKYVKDLFRGLTPHFVEAPAGSGITPEPS